MKKQEKRDIIAYLDKIYKADYEKLVATNGDVNYSGLTRLALITRIKVFILTGAE